MSGKNCNENYTTDQFNRDLESFYAFCKENRLSDEEIRKLCEPLRRIVYKAKLLKIFKLSLILALVIFICYILCCSDTVSWHLSAIGRILMIKLLPYYDWTVWKHEQCLIPKFGSQNIQNELPAFDCVLCENVAQITKKNNITPEELYENYIELHVPIILTNAEIQMKLLHKRIENVTDSLISNQILAEYLPCKLSTNIYNGPGTLSTILKKTKRFSSFFVHFQNCDFAAVKNFRIFTARPSFLDPAYVSPIQYNWLLASKDYNISKFKSIELQERVTVIVQTLGGTNFKLTPQSECEFDCHVLNFELKAAEALIFTSLWNLEYKPNPSGENVAVILEAH